MVTRSHSLVRFSSIIAVCLRHKFHANLFQQTDTRHHADQRSCGISTPAETKHKNLIARTIVVSKEPMDEAGAESDGFKLIITLVPDGNWQAAVVAAGLQLEREEPEILVLFGHASGAQISAIAGLPEVALIESEGLARAL